MVLTSFHRFHASLLNEHYKTVGRDHHVETALIRGDSGTPITHVLATINSGIAVENLFPPGVRYGQQILFYHITISKGSIVKARYDNDLFVSAPPLESNNSIGVPHMEDINVVAADRAEPPTERNGPSTQYLEISVLLNLYLLV